MKKLTDFMDKAHLLKLYFVGWLFTGALTAGMFYGFQLIGETKTDLDISGINCIKMGAISGLLFSLLFTSSVVMMRKSQAFWEYAKVVEELIEAADTKELLQSLFDKEFQDLSKKCQGGPQTPELTRLYTIIKTKYKLVK